MATPHRRRLKHYNDDGHPISADNGTRAMVTGMGRSLRRSLADCFCPISNQPDFRRSEAQKHLFLAVFL
ncbi:MAG: hypothetical protein JNJ77_04905 [Planctomycetia bacterium]|nr:hypothetical protein [Planctomycetia bacterium]